MGGTRFVGKALLLKLQSDGHDLTVFTRGRNPVPGKVEHLIGDRQIEEDLNPLIGKHFDVIVDSSGRTLPDTRNVLERTGSPTHRFLYVSSAGVYQDSDYLPLREDSPIDSLSRHIGKAHTEEWLIKEGVPFTSFRPTYIYGPGNYNSIERWFFDRIISGRVIPLPYEGSNLTHLGHVDDLADAMARSLVNESSVNQIFNCSGPKGVTFLGVVKAAALACGKNPEDIQIRRFDPYKIDPKGRKSFPLRLTNFLVDTTKIEKLLEWKPKYDLISGLRDSYINDYLINPTVDPDFAKDEQLTPF
ncbi:NAD-dependent epimerase/dehydratase family protein [Prochlorococcus sp. MIT 1341]|uniref:NAD-dependent epimerase/dehydratase family protein n=1 Tax=Prochlorococcus sp. MIT 1341 TaxID=3096221 RepID=UPI002A7554DA|nr:NAD-dependent epimerase/dehydratase family protein [Prochlorococcus sp. MIT 1341]